MLNGVVTIQVIAVLGMIALMSFEGRQVLAASRDRAVAGKPQSYLRINVHPHTLVET